MAGKEHGTDMSPAGPHKGVLQGVKDYVRMQLPLTLTFATFIYACHTPGQPDYGQYSGQPPCGGISPLSRMIGLDIQ